MTFVPKRLENSHLSSANGYFIIVYCYADCLAYSFPDWLPAVYPGRCRAVEQDSYRVTARRTGWLALLGYIAGALTYLTLYSSKV